MIDNFELIKSLLSFESEDIYYHLQILRRGKDHPELPAKSGYHIITEPFNLQQFKEKYPDIDVHKNNPTLLYAL